MNVYKVIVVLVVMCFSTEASVATDSSFSGDAFAILLAKLEQLYAKVAELESGIQKDREIIEKLNHKIDEKFDGAISVLNQAIRRNEITLQSQSNTATEKVLETLDRKIAGVTGAIDRVSGRMDHNLTSLQTQLNAAISKEREVTDAKLSTIIEDINKLSGMTNQKLSEVVPQLSQTIDQKHSTDVNMLDELAVLEPEEEKKLKEEIRAVETTEDFARLKSQSGAHLRRMSSKSCRDKELGKHILQSGTTDDIFLGLCTGSGWLEIQFRHDGSVNFTRSWKDYRDGFGNIDGEHWIGLEILHKLTSARSYALRVVLEDYNRINKEAYYSEFEIGDESENYALKMLGSYSGTAGDSLTYHKGMQFSTFDRDNDLSNLNCASTWKGGWWYKDCYESNLNGLHMKGSDEKYMVWKQFSTLDKNMGLQYSQMMIREK